MSEQGERCPRCEMGGSDPCPEHEVSGSPPAGKLEAIPERRSLEYVKREIYERQKAAKAREKIPRTDFASSLKQMAEAAKAKAAKCAEHPDRDAVGRVNREVDGKPYGERVDLCSECHQAEKDLDAALFAPPGGYKEADLLSMGR